MKKAYLIIVLFILLTGVTACSKSTNDQEAAAPPTVVKKSAEEQEEPVQKAIAPEEAEALIQQTVESIETTMEKLREKQPDWVLSNWAMEGDMEHETFKSALRTLKDALSDTIADDAALDPILSTYLLSYTCACDFYASYLFNDDTAHLDLKVINQTEETLEVSTVNLGNPGSKDIPAWKNIFQYTKEDEDWKLNTYQSISADDESLNLVAEHYSNSSYHENGIDFSDIEHDGHPYVLVEYENLFAVYDSRNGNMNEVLQATYNADAETVQADADDQTAEKDEKEQDTQNTEQTPPAEGWAGEWFRNELHDEGDLTITDVTANAFEFSLKAVNGAHTTGTSGTAAVQGHTATYKEPEFDCELTMELKDSRILVNETNGCMEIGGMGTSMAGSYEDTKKEPEGNLAVFNQITDEEDAKLRKLVGDHYSSFTNNMMGMFEREVLDDWGGKAVGGFVKGLVRTHTAIIMIDDDDHYYAATVVDGETIYYYTTNKAYKDQLPKTIQKWAEGLMVQPMKKIYKEI